MFYSQVVLSKKGPLGKVWLAAHHEKRLSRPQIFAFDVVQTAHDIAHPQVPLALRLSGHLLLGVVRIYSRKVNYLVEDAHEASVKIDTTFAIHDPSSSSTTPAKGGSRGGGGAGERGGGGGAASGFGASDRLDLANFGDLHQAAFSMGGGFEIPTDMMPELEDWDVAGQDDDDEEEGGDEGRGPGRGARPRDSRDGEGPPRKRHRPSDPADDSIDAAGLSNDTTLERSGVGGDDSRVHSRSGASRGAMGDDEGDDAGVGADRTLMVRRSQLSASVEQEDWGAFDPEDDDDDEDGEQGQGRGKDRSNTSVPEIETTRAADHSNLSDLQLRRASGILKDDEDLPSDMEFPAPDRDDYGNNTNPFDDDDEEEDRRRPGGPRASLALALSNDEAAVGQMDPSLLGGLEDSLEKTDPGALLDDDSDGKRNHSGVGGLDSPTSSDIESEDDAKAFAVGPAELADPAVPPRKKRGDATRKRRTRRIVMDVGATRLTSDEIRQNLADASDLEVAQVDPAMWIPGVDPSEQPVVLRTKSIEERIRAVMPTDVYLARPTCADNGNMAPELLNYWMSHTAPLLGKELPYKLVNRNEVIPPGKGDKTGAEEMDVDDEEAEIARKGRTDDEEMPEGTLPEDEEPEFPPAAYDEREFPPPEDDDQAAINPFEDEDDVAPPPPLDDEEPSGHSPKLNESGERSRLSGLSLGLANDFVREFDEEEEGDEDDPRQDQGDALASSSSKWHKHTVKVFEMLHRNMPDDEPQVMSFDSICDVRDVTRRTACGFFFELLQLKTWDFIELGQDEFFGDIKISPGVKFNEKPTATNRESVGSPFPGS